MTEIICKCGGQMYWYGYASMGSSHSNYYKCVNCGYTTEIYDKYIYPNIENLGQTLPDKYIVK